MTESRWTASTLSRQLRAEVGFAEAVALKAVEKWVDGRGVADIVYIGVTVAAVHNAAQATRAVYDGGAGVTLGGEGAGLAVAGQDGPLHGNLRRAIVQDVARERLQLGGAANGDARCATPLDYHQARLAVLVQRRGRAHLLEGDLAAEP